MNSPCEMPRPAIAFRWRQSRPGKYLRLFVARDARELMARGAVELREFCPQVRCAGRLTLQALELIPSAWGACQARHLNWRDLPGDWPCDTFRCDELLAVRCHALWDMAVSMSNYPQTNSQKVSRGH